MLNFREIKSHKVEPSYLFSCLITKLYEEAHVTILDGVYNEMSTTKNNSFERSKNESRPMLHLGKQADLWIDPLTIEVTNTTAVASGSIPGIQLSLLESLHTKSFIDTVPTSETTNTTIVIPKHRNMRLPLIIFGK